jgi:hypothetical protein
MRYTEVRLPRITNLFFKFFYKGDTIYYYWPWIRHIHLAGKYYSVYLSEFFSFFYNYNILRDNTTEFLNDKIRGLNITSILEEWVLLKYPHEVLVILIDIDVSTKPMSFWATIPYAKEVLFTKEVIILKCKDRRQMEQIVDSTSITFATAIGYVAGKVACVNAY